MTRNEAAGYLSIAISNAEHDNARRGAPKLIEISVATAREILAALSDTESVNVYGDTDRSVVNSPVYDDHGGYDEQPDVALGDEEFAALMAINTPTPDEIPDPAKGASRDRRFDGLRDEIRGYAAVNGAAI